MPMQTSEVTALFHDCNAKWSIYVWNILLTLAQHTRSDVPG